MPFKPKRPCRMAGCKNLCEYGQVYCKQHMANSYEAHRESSTERGYDAKWRIERTRFLNAHPLCVKCLARGAYIPATVVDHIVPHRGNKELFWDRNNWQALCATCHNEKTGSGL